MHFHCFIADLLGKHHADALILLCELEARLVEEGLDVLELRVVFILVLNLLLKSLAQLLGALLDAGVGSEEPKGRGGQEALLGEELGKSADSLSGGNESTGGDTQYLLSEHTYYTLIINN